MERVKAETRSKKRERETLVFRGAHFAVPWRACSISTSCIVQTRRSHPTSDIRIPPRIHTDTHVFTKGVARREGCLPPCRQSWYCAPAYTYVTRDLRRYTVSGPYSTAALKTGRIGTQLPAPWTPMVVVDRGEKGTRISTACKLSQRSLIRVLDVFERTCE